MPDSLVEGSVMQVLPLARWVSREGIVLAADYETCIIIMVLSASLPVVCCWLVFSSAVV